MTDLPRNEYLLGDCRSVMRALPRGRVHCVVVSIPYYGQRVYEGVEPSVWGGDPECEHVWATAPSPPVNYAGNTRITPASGFQQRSGAQRAGALFQAQTLVQNQAAAKLSSHRNGLGANSEFAGREDKAAIRKHISMGASLKSTLATNPATAAKTIALREASGFVSAGAYCQLCSAWRGLWGVEPTPEQYTANVVEFARAVAHALSPQGTFWLNIGDSYAGTGCGKGTGHFGQRDNPGAMIPHSKLSAGLKPKDLIGIPWLVALALRADGWYLRSSIVWAKGLSFCPTPDLHSAAIRMAKHLSADGKTGTLTDAAMLLEAMKAAGLDQGYSGSVMPDSCKDRPTRAAEYIFILAHPESKGRYHYDHFAAREAAVTPAGTKAAKGSKQRRAQAGVNARPPEYAEYTGSRNWRNVWTLATAGSKRKHYASYPLSLPEKCILAGTSEWGACPECGAQWERVVAKTQYRPPIVPVGVRNVDVSRGDKTRKLSGADYNRQARTRTLGHRPTCACRVEPVTVTLTPIRNYEPTTHAPPPKCKQWRSCGILIKAAWKHIHEVQWLRWWDAAWPVLREWPVEPAVVLDPCAGTNTTGCAAENLGRNWIAIDASPEYVRMGGERIVEHREQRVKRAEKERKRVEREAARAARSIPLHYVIAKGIRDALTKAKGEVRWVLKRLEHDSSLEPHYTKNHDRLAALLKELDAIPILRAARESLKERRLAINKGQGGLFEPRAAMGDEIE